MVARECDLIILQHPRFCTLAYFERLKPHVREGCVIVGLPGQPGFEFELETRWAPNLMSVY